MGAEPLPVLLDIGHGLAWEGISGTLENKGLYLSGWKPTLITEHCVQENLKAPGERCPSPRPPCHGDLHADAGSACSGRHSENDRANTPAPALCPWGAEVAGRPGAPDVGTNNDKEHLGFLRGRSPGLPAFTKITQPASTRG